MAQNRSVKHLLPAVKVDMGGIPVYQPLPTRGVEMIDPFLLLHHGLFEYKHKVVALKSGIGPHPHRGFSPVTFIFKGGVHHRDSLGNSSVIYEGGVQWINAGRGVIHSERPPADIDQRGGTQEILQLWINTPHKHKMEPAKYFSLTAEEMPKVKSEDEKVTIGVVSGTFENVKGKVAAQSELLALRLDFQKGGSYTFSIPETMNAFLYAINGSFRIKDYGLVEGKNLVHFDKDGDTITIEALEDFQGIMMAGVPLDEPVTNYGPFVMSNQTEILQAIRDYQTGKMGILIEE